MGRYQVPALIVLFPPVVVGGSALLQRLSARYRPVGAGLLLIMLLLTLWTALQAHRSYATATRSMAGLQIPLAIWIDQNLPDDAVVAILDAGALRFFGNRPTVDVIGLTTPGFAPLWREGMGAVFERLETLPQRPTHFAVFPNVSGVPYFEGTDLFSREVMRVTLPSFSNVAAVEGTKSSV